MQIKTAVFPVAGLGTRFLPATKAVPKELLPVLNKPLLQYAIEEARAAGAESFVFIHARGKATLEDQVDAFPALENLLVKRGKAELAELLRQGSIPAGDAVFVRQPEALGLGHAVWCARRYVGNAPFAVFLPDDLIVGQVPCMQQMVQDYQGGSLVAVMDVSHDQVSKYGILAPVAQLDKVIEASCVIEKPEAALAPSTKAVVGRYILPAEIMDYLESVEPGAGGEIQLTDAIAAAMPIHPLRGYEFEGQRFDCGSLEGFVEANVGLALRDESLRQTVMDALERHLSTEAAASLSPKEAA